MTEQAASPAPVSVAICGGGIGGVLLANALSKLDNVSFDLYEAAPQIAGSGLGVGLSSNAQRAMAMIGPDVADTLRQAGAVTMDPELEVRMGNGPEMGRLVHTLRSELPTVQVERAALLDALCHTVPAERLHPGKRLTALRGSAGGYTLEFEDGTTANADAVIGFDGIHSTIRAHILDADDAAATPQFAGIYSYWATVSADRVKNVLGVDEIPDTQQAWYGQDGYLLMNPMTGGEKVNIAGCKPLDAPWTDNPWFRQQSPEQARKDFADWGDFGEQMAELFVDEESGTAPALAFWDHADAPTYARDAVGIAGDAAHSMVPFQGSGAGQAIEDALVLSRVLARVETPDDVRAALAGYDGVRRPRTQSIVASSRNMGLTGLGRDPDTRGSFEELRAMLPTAWDHILSIDLEAHCTEAVQQMRQHRARGPRH